jgi:peptidoglycan/xylan/chitin deacetylase (PgdA/CDA1 family)
MEARSQIRAALVGAAAIIRLDEIALWLELKRRGRPFGLVIGIHETPASHEIQFRNQLAWVAEKFSIVDLPRFAELWLQPSQPGNSKKPPVLFTFDDGRESNYTVAAPLLESFGGRGVFFVVPSFAECSGEEARRFYYSRVNPGGTANYATAGDWKPMNPGQIAELAARGHTIGNHTLSHARLRGLSREELESEIGNSARKIGSWTGKPVEAFAWTFGWNEVDPDAWEVIRRYHRFCFAPCSGIVDSRIDTPLLIWRREVEVRYSSKEVRFQFSGIGDLAWEMRRRRLRSVLRKSSTGQNSLSPKPNSSTHEA